MATKTYKFGLPVFKQGEDFRDHLDDNQGDILEALKSSIEQYEYAVQSCQTLLSALSDIDVGEIEVGATGHSIMLSGPEELLQPLAEGDDSPLISEDDIEYAEDDDSEEEDL